ncbi:MAG: TonB-dependent receptor [Myxococcaceae bacterium]|nr:TonB-dependent receptor [Myxococcaceae bacterium]
MFIGLRSSATVVLLSPVFFLSCLLELSSAEAQAPDAGVAYEGSGYVPAEVFVDAGELPATDPGRADAEVTWPDGGAASELAPPATEAVTDAGYEPPPLSADTTSTTDAAEDPSVGEPALGAVIVTGVRGGQARTIVDTPSPVDVIGHRELQASGRTGLKEILGAIVPALSMPAQGGGGTSASVRPYTYRGLSGDYLLVLVNGKRRHTSALINNLSRISGGSTPVDLDLIPAVAISRIEILRDGAAAQYGSDAISGVMNIILDDAPEGLTFHQTAGQQYTKGAPLLQQQLSYGHKLGDRGGFFRFTAEAKYHGAADSSASPLPALKANGMPNYYYAPISANEPDPREAAHRDVVWAGGYGRSNRDMILNTSYNAELPVFRSAELYSFATLSYRNVKDARGAFAPNNIASLPELYPQGFQAYRRLAEWDGQVALGIRDDIHGWKWDLSTSYGRDWVRLNASNTLNPSLGPTSPTSFLMGHQRQDLQVNDLDVTKGFDIGWATPLQLSLGLQHRWERFQNKAGEPDSYRDGGYVIPLGTDPFHQAPLPGGAGGYGGLSPSPGLVSFTGTSPADARILSRNNYAAYAEVSANPFKPWYLGLAARAEHYDDSAGNVASGKIATRYEPFPGFAIRGGANTGFRAPSLAQTGFSTTQNTATVIMGERVRTTSKFLPVDSDAARALGASPLKPEKSISVTAGLTAQPVRDLHLTFDLYQTQVRDRIVRTDFLGTSNNGGAAISKLLGANGITGVDSAQYFTNAIDTTTRGLDIVADYTLKGGRFGTLRPTAAYNFAATTIDHVAGNPTQLQSLMVTRFGRQGKIDLTKGAPRSKLVLGANWAVWRFKSDVRVTRYDKYTEASTTPGFDQHFEAKWITDVDVGYGITDNATLAIGAYNAFNVYPQKHGVVSFIDGSGQYGMFSPFGLSGGFYYARLTINI